MMKCGAIIVTQTNRRGDVFKHSALVDSSVRFKPKRRSYVGSFEQHFIDVGVAPESARVFASFLGAWRLERELEGRDPWIFTSFVFDDPIAGRLAIHDPVPVE